MNSFRIQREYSKSLLYPPYASRWPKGIANSDPIVCDISARVSNIKGKAEKKKHDLISVNYAFRNFQENRQKFCVDWAHTQSHKKQQPKFAERKGKET